ncbi:hypothetical protein D9M72_611550 [compost metagenome]
MGWTGAKLRQFLKVSERQHRRKIEPAGVELADEFLQAGTAFGKGQGAQVFSGLLVPFLQQIIGPHESRIVA